MRQIFIYFLRDLDFVAVRNQQYTFTFLGMSVTVGSRSDDLDFNVYFGPSNLDSSTTNIFILKTL
jgi:hypothetical protein